MSFKNSYITEYEHNIIAFKNVGLDRINIVRTQSLGQAKAQSIRPNIIEGVATGNVSQLSRLCEDLVKVGQVDTAVFTDAKGNVLASTGDVADLKIAIHQRQAKIMAGGESVGFVADAGNRLPLLASVPIRKDGNIVGGVTIAVDLAAQNTFVDALKNILNVEATLFSGATRLSSTILENGRRVIGTTITDKEITQKVLGEGQAVSKIITLFDKPYIAVYWPLVDADGKPMGIGFVGKDMAQLDQSLSTVNRNTLLSALIVVMPPQHLDNLTLKDEIINAFRPVEQLFRIMDTSGLDVDGTIIRCYAEIGLELTVNFRERIEKLLGRNQGGAENAEG